MIRLGRNADHERSRDWSMGNLRATRSNEVVVDLSRDIL